MPEGAPRLADPQIDSLAPVARTDPGPAAPAFDVPAAETVQTGPSYAAPERDNAAQTTPIPADLPQGTGPRATSGDVRYDAVGIAEIDSQMSGVSIAHPDIAAGLFVELTALDSGHTIVALVGANAPSSAGRLIAVSPGAAQGLGIADSAPVRVRAVTPMPQEQAALRGGGMAARRIDAPQALLAALRKRLAPARQSVTAQPMTIATRPRAAAGPSYAPPTARPPHPSSGPGFYIQVVALSDAGRARSLASGLGGRVVPGGGFHRVQIGPYGSEKLAQQARDGVARRGYGDARIVKAN